MMFFQSLYPLKCVERPVSVDIFEEKEAIELK